VNSSHALLLLALAAPAALPVAAGAQSLLERPPNVSGDWTGTPGTLYFHFLHRFAASRAPERKVSNVPTFLVAAGLPRRLLVGVNYSSNSTLAPRYPNEWELLARWMPLAQDLGRPVDLGAQVGYNNAAEGVDAELSAARRVGVTRLVVAGRALSDPLERGSVRWAAAGGAAIRLGTYVAIAGDVATLVDRSAEERVAWSAGLHLALPLTPHTLSLQATNTLVTTLQGASRGTDDVRYGFEFTIPLSLRRYVGRRAEPQGATTPTMPAAPESERGRDTVVVVRIDTVYVSRPAPVDTPAARPVEPSVARSDTVRRAAEPPSRPPARTPAALPAPRTLRTAIRNTSYLQKRIEITVGSTVEWTNGDAMPHTVTATDRSFDSGLIGAGKTWRHTFTKPGTHAFYCMPHPFMKGTIVVKAP
jgi:plastocyanin